MQCAINRTFIASTEDVTIAIGHAFFSTYLTAMDVDAGLTKDITLTEQATRLQRSHQVFIHIHGTVATPAVLTTASSEDVALYETFIQVDIGSTGLEDGSIAVHQSPSETGSEGTASDRTELTTTVQASTYGTTVHIDGNAVHVTIDDITATEYITCHGDVIGLLVVQFLYIFILRL